MITIPPTGGLDANHYISYIIYIMLSSIVKYYVALSSLQIGCSSNQASRSSITPCPAGYYIALRRIFYQTLDRYLCMRQLLKFIPTYFTYDCR